MRYVCAVMAVLTMGAILNDGHIEERHTTLVCDHYDRLYDDELSYYANKYMVPELAAYEYTFGNGQEFRRSYPGRVWLLTRACVRRWVFVPAWATTLNISIGIDRAGYVPPTAYAVLCVGTPTYGKAPPSEIGAEVFGLAGEMPVAYVNQIPVIGPQWVVVSVTTEFNMPGGLWPDGERYPFAVQLYVRASAS